MSLKGVDERSEEIENTTPETAVLKANIHIEMKENGATFLFMEVDNTDLNLPEKIKIEDDLFRQFNNYYTRTNCSEEETSKFFDLIVDEYEEGSELNKRVISQLLKTSLNKYDNIQISEPLTVLDFGIGSGLSSKVIRREEFPKMKFHGVDISDEMIGVCRKRGIRARKIRNQNTKFPNNYFHIVILSFVTHYFSNIEKFKDNFREIYRILRPSGTVAFNLHRNEWNNDQIYREALIEIGFENIGQNSNRISVLNENYKVEIMSAKK